MTAEEPIPAELISDASALQSASCGQTLNAIVELRNVSLRFGERRILDNVTLAVKPQDRLCVIGQSGAGKTTILRLILGILAPTDGSVFFKQQDVSRLSPHELQRIRKRIGMVYQDGALISSLNVHGNLALPLEELTDKTPAEIDAIVEEKLEMVELAGEGRTMPHELSGGMRKRVGLARALVMEPELILFDEPTAGLDPVVAAVIDELIIELTERSRVTSIVVTHLMDSAFRIATRMAMLHHGQILADGTPAELKASLDPVLVQFLSGSTTGPILERSKYHMLSPLDPKAGNSSTAASDRRSLGKRQHVP